MEWLRQTIKEHNALGAIGYAYFVFCVFVIGKYIQHRIKNYKKPDTK